MTITSKHAEYSANIDAWVKVDDVCKGQKAIKDKGKTYLPKPVTFEDAEYEEMRQWGENQYYRPFDIAFRNNLLKTCLKIKKVK